MNKNMQNEPNLKNTKINLSSLSKMVCVNFRPLDRPKNEPNTNPIYTQFAVDMLSWPAVQPLYYLLRLTFASHESRATRNELNMQNEPNLKNSKERQKNEPNLWKTNPISNFQLGTHGELQNDNIVISLTKK